MTTWKEYVTHSQLLHGTRHLEYPLDETQSKNLGILWFRVNALLNKRGLDVKYQVNSGYRPGKYNQAAGGTPQSRHITCKAVDLGDVDGSIDKWLDAHPELLEEFKLSREDPSRTAGWAHLDCDTRGTKYITFKI